MPRKIRPPHRLASYLRAQFKHLLLTDASKSPSGDGPPLARCPAARPSSRPRRPRPEPPSCPPRLRARRSRLLQPHRHQRLELPTAVAALPAASGAGAGAKPGGRADDFGGAAPWADPAAAPAAVPAAGGDEVVIENSTADATLAQKEIHRF